METEFSIALKEFRKSKDYISSKKEMLKRGMFEKYIDNILVNAFTSGWAAKPADYKEQFADEPFGD